MPVVKTQVSSALRVPRPGSAEGRELLARFDEPKFLHQTRECVNAHVEGTDDLPEALEGGLPAQHEWRVHFHVPVNTRRAHDAGRAERRRWRRSPAAPAPLTRHFEVETYTWSVMRDAPQDDEGLVAGLAGELEWTRDRLVALGAEVVGMTLVVVIDAVGLTPRALKHMPRCAQARRRRLPGDAGHDHSPPSPAPSRRRCSPACRRPTTASSATAGTSATSARSSSGASTTSSSRARRCGRPRAAPSPATAPRTSAGGTRWAPTTDLTVTPRPIYHADGRKSPDCYTYPPQLHDNLTGPLGEFPLFQYWGPTANIKSTKWIADAAEDRADNEALDLLLVYLPHLDYDHQRFGPEGTEALKAARELDEVAGDLIDHARARGDQVVVLSEYGITTPSPPGRDQPRAAPRGPAERVHAGGHGVPGPVDLARVRGLRPPDRARLRPRTRPTCRRRARRSPRWTAWGRSSRARRWRAAGLDHERSGELVVLAERDAWFTYHYWLDNAHAPDFGQQVEIHRKPGYDPAELFMDPDDEKGAKLRAGLALARKKTGFRYVMSVVGLDASKYVKGTHGLLPDNDEDAPVFLCSEPSRRARPHRGDRRPRPAARTRRRDPSGRAPRPRCSPRPAPRGRSLGSRKTSVVAQAQHVAVFEPAAAYVFVVAERAVAGEAVVREHPRAADALQQRVHVGDTWPSQCSSTSFPASRPSVSWRRASKWTIRSWRLPAATSSNAVLVGA